MLLVNEIYHFAFIDARIRIKIPQRSDRIIHMNSITRKNLHMILAV